MIAHVSFGEAAKVLLAGATFVPLAVALGWGLARAGITARGARGELRKGPCLVIALSFGALVFVHAMAVWWIAQSAFHPSACAFYGLSSAVAGTSTRAQTPKPAKG